MQYAAAVLAFVAVVVGIVGNTWDAKAQRPTELGLATVVIAAGSLIVSVLASRRDRKQIRSQEAQLATIQALAVDDLRELLHQFLFPFELLWQNIVWAVPAPPKYAALTFDSHRFDHDTGYILSKLRDGAYQKAWDDFAMDVPPKYPSLYPPMTWADFFSKSAKRLDDGLEARTTRYGGRLDATELADIRRLQKDQFFRMRLLDMPTIVQANKPRSYPLSAGFNGPDDGTSYLEFLKKLEVLLKRAFD
jgi:hypothetical protein